MLTKWEQLSLTVEQRWWCSHHYIQNVVTWQVPLMEQKLHILFGAPDFFPGFWWDLCYSIFSFLFSVLSTIVCLCVIFFLPLCYLSFCDLQLLITSLVSFCHYIIYLSVIYSFWLPLWYLQTFLDSWSKLQMILI